MRIVHYLTSIDLRDGGVVRAVLDLCPALARAGHRVTLLTFNDADAPREWPRAPAPRVEGLPSVTALARPRLPGGLLGRAALATAAAAVRDADVVHIHSMWIPSNGQVARLARASGVPYIWSVHGMLDDWCMAQKGLKKRVYLALAARRALERAAVVHCTAQAELEQARKHFPRGRGVVIPLIFELASYRELPGPGEARARFGEAETRPPLLLFLSRFHHKKGADVLLRAAAILRDRGVEARVALAGGGDAAYEAELKRLVGELNLGEHVAWCGFVTGDLKTSLYQAADLFVLPSSQENFGYVIVEALACGTPVVTTKGVGIWPDLQASGAAALVEPEPTAVADAIAAILSDPSRRREMGAAGRRWAFSHLDPARIMAGFERMYAEAAATRTRGGGPAADASA